MRSAAEVARRSKISSDFARCGALRFSYPLRLILLSLLRTSGDADRPFSLAFVLMALIDRLCLEVDLSRATFFPFLSTENFEDLLRPRRLSLVLSFLDDPSSRDEL